MILNVRVVPKSSRALVKEDAGGLKVYLTKPACDGLANKQLVELLADHFSIKKYTIEIVRGHTSRDKVVRIDR